MKFYLKSRLGLVWIQGFKMGYHLILATNYKIVEKFSSSGFFYFEVFLWMLNSTKTEFRNSNLDILMWI